MARIQDAAERCAHVSGLRWARHKRRTPRTITGDWDNLFSYDVLIGRRIATAGYIICDDPSFSRTTKRHVKGLRMALDSSGYAETDTRVGSWVIYEERRQRR